MAKHKKRERAEPVAVAPQASGDTTAASVDRERIASRAYELYMARGREDGRAEEDWLSAERELLSGVRADTQ